MKKIIYLVLFVAFICSFQNCSQVHFAAFPIDEENLKSSNNGTGYGGKPNGDFYRFRPEFTCENKEAPVSEVLVTPTEAVYTENKKLQCGAVKQNLDPNFIDSSVFQNDVIGLREGIYESQLATPMSIPANLVEVWCRTSKDLKGIETITHFNRSTSQADTEIYHMGATAIVKQSFAVSRLVSAQKVTIQDGKDLLIEVYRDKPALEFGLFQGTLEAVVDGVKISQSTSCRLGGSFDPQIWPAQQIVDTQMQKFKISPDLSFFGYTSSLSSEPLGLFSADAVGTHQIRVTPPMLSAGVGNFEIAPMSNAFLYWGDPRYKGGIELFKVNRDSTNHFQLNDPLTNSLQGQVTDIRFSADGSRVFYRDGQQETGPEGGADIEMWLRSVPLSGGRPTVVNPPLPLAGDISVYEFGISKSQNKVAYLSGDTSAELFISDFDGKNLIKPLNGVKADWWEKVIVPDPGEYVFFHSSPVVANGKMLWTLHAVSFDGSSAVALPVSWELMSVSPSGQSALIYDPSNPVDSNGKKYFKLKLMDLRTGSLADLPLMNQPAFSKDSTSLIGGKLDGLGGMQATAISIGSLSETPICPSMSVSALVIKEVSGGAYLISAFDSQTRILSLYIQTAKGSCLKKNSFPVADPNVQDLAISPDQKKVLIKVALQIDGKAHDQIYYLPMSGEPPLAVNTAVFTGAKISSFQFLNDSKTILYLGDQIRPGETNAFIWRAP